MNVLKHVRRIQSLQERYIKIQKDIQARISKMTKPVEKYIKRRFSEEFPDADIYFLSSFQCGCLTDKWIPHVFVYRVNGLSYSPDGYWYEELDKTFKKHLPPISSRRMLSFLKNLSEEVGVKVSLVRQKPYFLYEEEFQLGKKSNGIMLAEEEKEWSAPVIA